MAPLLALTPRADARAWSTHVDDQRQRPPHQAPPVAGVPASPVSSTPTSHGRSERALDHARPGQGHPVSDQGPLWLVRYRRGVVSETKRVVHLVPVPSSDTAPAELVALCGTRIGPGLADLLTQFEGMPCVECLANAPVPL